MKFYCPKCNAQIISRSFGKCPSCYEVLPEKMQLSELERDQHEELKEFEDHPTPYMDGKGMPPSG